MSATSRHSTRSPMTTKTNTCCTCEMESAARILAKRSTPPTTFSSVATNRRTLMRDMILWVNQNCVGNGYYAGQRGMLDAWGLAKDHAERNRIPIALVGWMADYRNQHFNFKKTLRTRLGRESFGRRRPAGSAIGWHARVRHEHWRGVDVLPWRTMAIRFSSRRANAGVRLGRRRFADHRSHRSQNRQAVARVSGRRRRANSATASSGDWRSVRTVAASSVLSVTAISAYETPKPVTNN